MKLGIITGSGTYGVRGLDGAVTREVETGFGAVHVTEGRLGGTDVVHISRHGEGHPRLSSHVNHRANVLALQSCGARAVLAVTVCGTLDRTQQLGELVVFDDLHFIANRLPDGSLCTLHTQAGSPGRAHWVFDEPFSAPLRAALLAGAADAGIEARDGGCYGHVDGPRFNTRSEIRSLALCGVSAVSQTGGPETVLCGEAELPYALLGFVTDYANGVSAEPTPVAQLLALIAQSTEAFVAVLAAAATRLRGETVAPTGTQLGF